MLQLLQFLSAEAHFTVYFVWQISGLVSNITAPSPLNFLIIHGTADGEYTAGSGTSSICVTPNKLLCVKYSNSLSVHC